MLAKSDVSVVEALARLAKFGLETALLVPTQTGLEKSILDATGPVRDFLRLKGIHEFDSQGQGPEHKVMKECFFVTPSGLERSNISLYRPTTKTGDPRIWLGAATRHHARAWNLLALFVVKRTIYVLNMSDPFAVAALDNAGSPFRRAIDPALDRSATFEELMEKLRGVSRQGFVRTRRPGDTGVGMTLETLLGIRANAKQAPDFKGIELKARRNRGSSRDTRSTLFSKVPNWKLSPVRTAMQLVEKRGYVDKNGRKALYHTLRGDRSNSLGLMLEIATGPDWLIQVYVDKETGSREHDVTWEMPILKQDLAAKHRETFWVHAKCRGHGETEEFHYYEVKHTRGPIVSNLPTLIEAGVITVDYALHLSGTRARDHGYLFKIYPQDIAALFPPPAVYELC